MGLSPALAAVAALALALALGACSSTQSPSATPTTHAGSASTGSASTSRPPTTSTTASGVTFGQSDAAIIAACQSDSKLVDVALEAYDAETGNYPTPPSPWSAATYATNYQPLTAAGHGGPFMPSAPTTTRYVIEYDAAGHVWVEPAGQYDATYNPSHAAASGGCYLATPLS